VTDLPEPRPGAGEREAGPEGAAGPPAVPAGPPAASAEPPAASAGPPAASAEPPAASAEAPAVPAELTERDRALLALEQRGWPGPGAKERAIREQLGISPTRYYQLLGALLDDERALAYAPVTVNRLRRVRQARRDQR
jgi:hypothetical protein